MQYDDLIVAGRCARSGFNTQINLRFVALVILVLSVAGCASNEQPISAKDAMAQSRSQQAAPIASAYYSNEIGDPIYQDPNERRLYGDACRQRPVVQRAPRRRASNASERPAQVPQRVPFPRTTLSVPIGGEFLR